MPNFSLLMRPEVIWRRSCPSDDVESRGSADLSIFPRRPRSLCENPREGRRSFEKYLEFSSWRKMKSYPSSSGYAAQLSGVQRYTGLSEASGRINPGLDQARRAFSGRKPRLGDMWTSHRQGAEDIASCHIWIQIACLLHVASFRAAHGWIEWDTASFPSV